MTSPWTRRQGAPGVPTATICGSYDEIVYSDWSYRRTRPPSRVSGVQWQWCGEHGHWGGHITEECMRSRHIALSTFSRDNGTSFIEYAEEDNDLTTGIENGQGRGNSRHATRRSRRARHHHAHCSSTITATSTETQNIRPPPTNEKICTAKGHINEQIESSKS